MDLLQKAQAEEWFKDPQWLHLGQYQKNIWGRFSSSVVSEKFFLSPQGKNDPAQELLATLEALTENTRRVSSRDGRFSDPVACVFPARKLWLERKSGRLLPSPVCERFARFQELLQAQALTYVFSSYYLNNPASAFGHTFLRMNQAPSARDGEHYELSDYGVSYAAVPVSQNPFVYSFLGVTGLMPGAFDITPYYYKVREYNDFESRDLWEYDLNLTPAEVEMAVAAVWELLDVGVHYNYFSENCSYRILSILEIARPDLDLTGQQKSQVLPADTVQSLYRVPGLVRRVRYRPSVRASFQARYQELSVEGQKRLRGFAREESLTELTEQLSPEEKRRNLDAAMDYLDARYPKEILRKEGKYFFKKEVLVARAEAGGTSSFLQVPTPSGESPHGAHGSRRWGLGGRRWEGDSLWLLDMRLALHDLLDPSDGYPATAQITMGYLGVSWAEKTREWALDKLILYDVISLAPVDDFNQRASWRLKFSLERGFENECTGLCRWTELSGGSGVTGIWGAGVTASFWLRVTGQASSDFQGDHWRLGAGPALSFRWSKDPVSVLAEIYYRYDYRTRGPEVRQNFLGAQWRLNKSLSLRALLEDLHGRQRAEGRLLYYY